MSKGKTLFATVLLVLGLGTAWAQNEGLDDLIEPRQQPAQTAQENTQGQQQQAPDVERFQDWAVRCGTLQGTGEQACEMFQGVTQSESGKQVMAVVIGYPPELEQPVAVFQLPLGMHLPPGVEFRVDGGEPVSFPVQVCFQQGCRADLLLEGPLLQKLRSGTKATVTIRGLQGRAAELPVSLMGFTAALERVSP